MSAALLDDLLAGYVAPFRAELSAPAPAKTAKPANRESPRGPAPTLTVCEGQRIPANRVDADDKARPQSHPFAGVRNTDPGKQREEPCGPSQDSQNSQAYPPRGVGFGDTDLPAATWADADIARFLYRRARLLRWGWAEPDAEKLAERLVRRDREHDDRVSCADCGHYRPGRCGNHRSAGLQVPDAGRDLAAMLQRCPGFQSEG